MLRSLKTFAVSALLLSVLTACASDTGFVSFTDEPHPMHDFSVLDF